MAAGNVTIPIRLADGRLIPVVFSSSDGTVAGNLTLASAGSGGGGGDATAANQVLQLAKTLGGQQIISRGAVANAAAWAAGQLCAPLIVIDTGIGISTLFSSITIKLKVRFVDTTTQNNPIYQLFDTNPTASAFIAGAAQVTDAADVDKMISSATLGFTGGVATGLVEFGSFTATRVQSDATGKLYMSLQGTGVGAYTPNTWRYEFSGQS